jgi:hypothetical protein
MRLENLSAASACAMLREAGLDLAPDQARVEAREERWAVSLPGEVMAWFPASEAGRRRLAVERRVLRLLHERCTFQAPRILFESAAGFDVRAIVPGYCDPWGLYQRIREDAALGRDIGRSVGAILVEQHTRVAVGDVAGWLPERVSWPEPGVWIRERVPQVVSDARLLADIDQVLRSYQELRVDPEDCVLIHSDLGLHNLAVDPDTLAVRGVFDYDGAAWADRHHDFRYLVLDLGPEELLEAALAVYEPALGRTLSRERIWLYNTVCAFSYLAFRVGVPPDVKWCGRTLAEDLRWVRRGIGRVQAFMG